MENFDISTHEKEELEVDEHHYFVIEPNIYHNLIGLEESLLVVLPDKAFDPNEEDIYYLSESVKNKYKLD